MSKIRSFPPGNGICLRGIMEKNMGLRRMKNAGQKI